MLKVLIPVGIGCLLGITGVVVNAVAPNFVYQPETVVLESAGGESKKVTTTAELKDVLKAGAVHTAAYYQGLEALTEDPKPVEGQINSLGVVCSGFVEHASGGHIVRTERTLTIAQNEKGVNYRIDAVVTETENDVVTVTKTDMVVSWSRHGMYVKYNDYLIETDSTAEADETRAAIAEAIGANRGKWYFVGLNEEHQKKASAIPTTMEEIMDAMIIGVVTSTTTQMKAQFGNSVDSNNETLLEIANTMEKMTLTDKGNSVYTGKLDAHDMTITLANAANPKIEFDYNDKEKNSTYYTEEHQELELFYIDDCAVKLQESASLDFYDLLGGVMYDMMKAYPTGA